jgi:hypothetical protein
MCIFEEVLKYHVWQKQAYTLHLVSELLDDLPSSDDRSEAGSSQSFGNHSRQDSSDFKDLNCLEDEMFQCWDTRTVIQLLLASILEACPPVKKAGQLDLYLTDFQHQETYVHLLAPCTTLYKVKKVQSSQGTIIGLRWLKGWLGFALPLL